MWKASGLRALVWAIAFAVGFLLFVAIGQMDASSAGSTTLAILGAYAILSDIFEPILGHVRRLGRGEE